MTAVTTKPVISGEADILGLAPVIPVVVVDEVAQAVPLARALLRGGIPVIELTLRSEAGLGAIEAVASEVEGIVVGAGTVVTPAQVQQVVDAGAQFLVTPGSPPRLVEAALGSGLPLLAGAGTLTEMLTLAEAGLEVQKFFPAEASGGRPYLSAVAGPCPQLRFCPTGGITPQTAADWLALPNVGCVGGSWLTPKDAVAQGDWARIEQLAREAAALPR
ncbi:bifunctional 4-hydroxy-2-oxoglutarate aldolase/2-dehydro-3-deoxy-phosphogluconate aldolase [Phycicoccus sp. 3266]|jgi:2-dehydro-3-deoxyphosphogluconate aldolase/(4S)-4-hydroxy-2-oxoglutarate aldolase|uniref:bifunctional 4-hydroxy-2-oxoglutarate aldolase/2-dehydro-3-deoxy-phosphogluconate aldolase n=1 Tax=Phycicoccus sp. 3266 TaxID=2817751 RepID=UPI002856607C|nr:bifunctional 4-hydroxy-2-oxoglutarate aldolase/2-dehydro-3-deoxy-phosphogluconate aldolase [Phycicoccus sp. 3266]MDR6862753.1 2-dehydro-3-deoxyphosphogluconate aldolase/(4S)-4-hydroxy-2-oxoglutarate aldolase [Phycicoccus sp. 3266]